MALQKDTVYRIGRLARIHVGEDEADIKQQKVSWVSPIAAALLGKALNDTAIWQRPAYISRFSVGNKYRISDRQITLGSCKIHSKKLGGFPARQFEHMLSSSDDYGLTLSCFRLGATAN